MPNKVRLTLSSIMILRNFFSNSLQNLTLNFFSEVLGDLNFSNQVIPKKYVYEISLSCDLFLAKVVQNKLF